MEFEQAIEILGVTAEADLNTARRAYLQLIRAHRPERDPEGFRRVREAWEAFEEGYRPPPPDEGASVLVLEVKLPNDLLSEAREAFDEGDYEATVSLSERALSMDERLDFDHVAFLLLSLWGEEEDGMACRLMAALEARLSEEKPQSFSPPMAMILDLWRNHRNPASRIHRALILLGRRKRIDGMLGQFEPDSQKGRDKGGREGNRVGGRGGKVKERFKIPVDPFNKLK